MNKKRIAVFLGLVLSIILIINLVSAQPAEDLKSFIEGVRDVLVTLFETILGPGPTGSVGTTQVSFLFARVLFMLIVFVIVWAVVGRIPLLSTNSWITFVISGAVALLSTRFLLEPGWVQAILLPYSTFGIAVTALLPLILYTAFVYNAIQFGTLRKIAWVFAGIVFLGLWYSRYKELAGAFWIYPIAALVCFGLFIFDGTIRGLIVKLKVEKASKGYKGSAVMAVQKKIKDITDIYDGTGQSYIGGTFTPKSTGKSGTEAYILDMEYLEHELHQLLR